MYSVVEVAKHNTEKDCWVIIDGKVYDLTDFLDAHPGGRQTIARHAGKDVTDEFNALHSWVVMHQYGPKLQIGTVDNVVAKPASPALTHKNGSFGDLVPFGDPYWYNEHMKSPYYTATHREFREKVRKFVEVEVRPYIDKWEDQKDYPVEMHEKCYKAGIYGAIWPAQYGGTPPEGFDFFHDLIMVDELARCGAGGILWACFFSFGISLPPVLYHGSKHLKDMVCRDVITGKKIMSLAVTEPYIGSDVANLRTTAVDDGDYFIVCGEKKFITSGMKAHFFTTAVRTGGSGIGGISLLCIPSDLPGIGLRKLETQGWWISNTAYITFDNVKVHKKYLVGEVNQGFKLVMENFNHERFVLGATSNRYARVCLEDAITYARKRKTFNKRLVDHQVIRHKIAEMAMKVEAGQALIEQIAYQFNQKVPDTAIGGAIALMKVYCTKTMEFCAREASQIVGGSSYLRKGPGSRIERLYREVRVNAIGGGSEEIMLDLAMKQAKL